MKGCAGRRGGPELLRPLAWPPRLRPRSGPANAVFRPQAVLVRQPGVRPSRALRDAVRQFQHRHYRHRDLRVGSLRANRLQHLVRGLALALRSDDHGGIEDQSHAGGSNGSRWLSMAAWTSRAKPASMIAVESFGMSANTSETRRRGGSLARNTATGWRSSSTTTSTPCRTFSSTACRSRASSASVATGSARHQYLRHHQPIITCVLWAYCYVL